MKKINLILGLIVLCTLFACSDKEGATKALQRGGYKPIKVGGRPWFTDYEDHYQTRFVAVALNGDTVSGIVTKGMWSKASTIRVED